jgi:hypothetical protein
MVGSIYEFIGRLVVWAAWQRYGRQIKMVTAGLAVLGLAAGFALSKRQPPEG